MNTQDQIKKEVANLGVSFKKFFKFDDRNKVFVVFGEKNGKEIVVKFVAKSNVQKSENLHREVAAEKAISEYCPGLRRPRVLSSGESSDLYWLIREYQKGNPLSDAEEGEGEFFFIDKIGILSKKFIEMFQELCALLLANQETIESIPVQTGDQDLFQNRRFDPKIESNDFELIERSSMLKINEAVSFYNSYKPEYFSKQRLSFQTGDLVPSNLLVFENKLFFSDFEWFCVDNYTLDIALLWLILWRYPNWQAEILNSISIEKEESFRASVIRIVLSWYPIKPELAEKFRDHIWTRYLHAAGQSFQRLQETR